MKIYPFTRPAHWFSLGVVCSFLAVASGCGSPRRGPPVAGPMISADPKVEQGRQVFMQHCHTCHPGGEGGLGPSLNDKPLPGFAIRTQVRHGFGVMPSFGKRQIAPDQLDALVDYLKALRRHRPERPSS